VLKIPAGVFVIVKEILRHLIRRPIVGISVVAKTGDGRLLLIRRGDTHLWALPGGTLEWGETLRQAAVRELLEEAGVKEVKLGNLTGVYSDPEHDPRFHAVTILVEALIAEPSQPPYNPAEVLEARLFSLGELPIELSHGNKDMLERALAQSLTWE
jgi:8-oxo-dGTP diphosphatase